VDRGAGLLAGVRQQAPMRIGLRRTTIVEDKTHPVAPKHLAQSADVIKVGMG
jgi:hypothetical protein